MTEQITTHFLEMLDPAELQPRCVSRSDLRIMRAEIPSPELNRYLYTSVGGDWNWCSRLPWSYETWVEYLDRPELETWVAYLRGTPAGYFELEYGDDGAVEIVYFGLLPQFMGEGLGGHLLTEAVRCAWAMGARRVWLTTCSNDHEHALANYEARGFRVYDTKVRAEQGPAIDPGPWPGAYRRVEQV